MTDTRILTARDLDVSWIKSSYSNGGNNCVEVAGLPTAWVRSSYSNGGNTCVEVGGLPGTVAVRDSKNPDGPALLMPSAAFESFVTGVRESRFES